MTGSSRSETTSSPAITEADREGRLGEVEGLQVSLAGAQEKLARLDRHPASRSAVDLGIPTIDRPDSARPSVIRRKLGARNRTEACRFARKHAKWELLAPGQDENLTPLGEETLANVGKSSSGAFERGVQALRQYKSRTGSVTVPRGHVEELEDGASVKLGVWISTTKSRRAKLMPEQLAQLAEIGLE
ncbi:helicase associated domain-containing protein [Streptomyces lasiicapitis]|uniref:helicase associated domain-containing protein n=1 Tax=Streptomyces lasiicapitis TaxID=1923961 RepID=UPI003652814F